MVITKFSNGNFRVKREWGDDENLIVALCNSAELDFTPLGEEYCLGNTLGMAQDLYNCNTGKTYMIKGIEYPDEEGWYMDYPDGATAYKRFADQCVLSHEQILEAMNNTNVFLEVEEYDCPIFNHEVKLPTIYPELTQDERDKKFTDLVWQLWEEQKYEVPQSQWSHYVSEIMNEVETVVVSHTADYFLLDYEIVKLAKARGGELTPTGRGCFTEEALVHTKTGLKRINDLLVLMRSSCITNYHQE